MDGQYLFMTRNHTAKWEFQITDPGETFYTQTLAGATVYFTAKRDRTDATSAPVFTKSSPAGGVSIIANGSASTPGIVSVEVAPADTSSLPSYKCVLDWDVIVVDSAGKHYPALRGALGVEIEANTAQ